MPPIVETTNWMDYPLMKRQVTAGLKVGFRAFDTARDYGNEPIVGQVMKECLAEQGLKREDVFITTKIGNGQQKLGNIEEQVDISLKNLQTDYIDLWMMHWPYPGYYVDTWHKMEKIYKSGKVRAIGMANFRIRHFEHLFMGGGRNNAALHSDGAPPYADGRGYSSLSQRKEHCYPGILSPL